MAQVKKQEKASSRKPFDFGEAEQELVKSVVSEWEQVLIGKEKGGLPSDVVVCAFGNFLARFCGTLAIAAHQQGQEYFYLESVVDWALNTFRHSGVDIDKQMNDFNKKIVDRMKKQAAAVKPGQA